MTDRIKLANIKSAIDILEKKLDTYTGEKEPVRIIFLLICHFCSNRESPKGILNSYRDAQLKTLDFTHNTVSDNYSATRFQHRKNLKEFLTPLNAQEEDWNELLSEAGFKDEYQGLQKLGGKQSDKAAMGFDFIQVIFYLSAKLNNVKLEQHIIKFIRQYPKHHCWSKNHHYVVKSIKKLINPLSQNAFQHEEIYTNSSSITLSLNNKRSGFGNNLDPNKIITESAQLSPVPPEALILDLSNKFERWDGLYLEGGYNNMMLLKGELENQWSDIDAAFLSISQELRSEKIDPTYVKHFAKLPNLGQHILDFLRSGTQRLTYLFPALQAAETANDPIQFTIHYDIGFALKDINHFSKAIYHFKKCIAGAEKLNDWSLISIANFALSSCENSLKNITSSQSAFQAASNNLSANEKLSPERLKLTALICKAKHLISSEQSYQATELCKKADEIAKELNATRLISNNSSAWSHALMNQGKFEEAKDKISECLMESIEINDTRVVIESAQLLADLHFKTNEIDKSYQNYQRLEFHAEKSGNLAKAQFARQKMMLITKANK